MSNYNARRGQVSQFIRDLNALNRPETHGDDTFSIENDLALFTNTQFFDFDSGQNTDFQAEPVKGGEVEAHSAAVSEVAGPTVMTGSEMPNMEFMSGDFSNFPHHDFTSPYPPPSLSAFTDGAQAYQPLQPNHGSMYGGPMGPQQPPFPQDGARGIDKRKSDGSTSSRSQNFEESSRMAAEEDKRRRNTAASARFRVKKKQREQALEKSAKEMTDKLTSLENKVSQLETENKWLKNLLVDKNEGNDEIISMWKEFAKKASTKDPVSTSKESGESVKAER
ncbi:hypothetical protein S40285_02008 [Stachybotrys chlorohalonatus IBT 40285]|uniref:BZIP domain-containing protein n=1 Tax=Stachybotrys chlorohalonatus (strain IBT 40285) TaxID=1283841 RepID=A0A084QIF5_STAC4|nr:hypothetical protein S40285_02008 [Stachybotrys chlorohalonata IBT 40285]